jgi:hypothetical protein
VSAYMSHNVPKTSVPYEKTYFESVAVVQNAQINVKGTTFPVRSFSRRGFAN